MFRRSHDNRTGPRDHTGEELRNEALVDAMRAVSINDTQTSRALLFQLMLDSMLVVMSPNSPPHSKVWTAQKGDTLQLVTLSDGDGTVLPVFTSIASLLRFRPEGVGYIALPGSALFEMATNAGTNNVVFDPGSPTTGFVTRHEIEALGRGRLPIGGGSEVVAAETSIRIGRPAVPPSAGVLNAVQSVLRGTPGVSRAWLTMIQQGESRPEVVVAVQLSAAAGESTMERIVNKVGEQCGANAADIRFVRADESLQRTLDAGAGDVLFVPDS